MANERGLASGDLATLADRVLGAWDAFLDVAAGTALERPSRLPGWTGRDVLVHLGSWPERPALDDVLAGARRGAPADGGDPDARNAALVAAHRGAGREEVLAALRANRDSVAAFLSSPEAREIGLRPTGSALGPLPALTVVSAVAYELAVHALDVAPCPAPPPPAHLLQAGVAALVDVTGALAARAGLVTTASVTTPAGGWSFTTTGDGGWVVPEHAPGARPPGAGVEAPADVLLDVSAGRRAVPPLLLRGELQAHDVPKLLALAPLVEGVPGLPGGAVLGTAARYLGGLSRVGTVGRLAGRLPRLGRG